MYIGNYIYPQLEGVNVLYVALFFVALIAIFGFGALLVRAFTLALLLVCKLLYVAVVLPIALGVDVVCMTRAWWVRRQRRFALASPAGVQVAYYEIVEGGE